MPGRFFVLPLSKTGSCQGMCTRTPVGENVTVVVALLLSTSVFIGVACVPV